MKIIFLASAKSIHSLRWINYFSFKTNHDIVWISTEEPGYETLSEYNKLDKKIKIYTFKKFKNKIKILKELLFSKNSLVQIHYIGWHSLLIPLLNKNNKIIATPWGSDLLVNKNFLKKIWFNYFFRRSDAVICDSKRLGNIAKNFGAKENSIYIYNFGIDTDFYRKGRSIFSDLNNIVIGSNRRLEKIYDIKTFINAAEKVLKLEKNISFLIAGEGSLRNELNDYTQYKGLKKNIKFLGALNQDEVYSFYNSIDIYVSTSLSDGGLSSSVAEAMSFERLVLVTNNSDNDKWIIQGHNGFLFKNKDSIELSNLIMNNIKNIDSSIKISKNARKIILEKCSYNKEMEKIYLKYLDLFNDRLNI